MYVLDKLTSDEIYSLRNTREREAILKYKRIRSKFIEFKEYWYETENFVMNVQLSIPHITQELVENFDTIEEFDDFYDAQVMNAIEITEYNYNGGLEQIEYNRYRMPDYGEFTIKSKKAKGKKRYSFKTYNQGYYECYYAKLKRKEREEKSKHKLFSTKEYRESKTKDNKKSDSIDSNKKDNYDINTSCTNLNDSKGIKKKNSYDIKKRKWFLGNTYIHNESEYLDDYAEKYKNIISKTYDYNKELNFTDTNNYFEKDTDEYDEYSENKNKERDFSFLLDVNTLEYENSETSVWNQDEILSSDIVTDANNLFNAFLDARKSSPWKEEVQRFSIQWLLEISHLQKEIRTRRYKPLKATKFMISERGKTRVIRGGKTRDRVVEHSLNDNILVPIIRRKLIYDNGASLQGKGVDFTRRRLVEHLTNYYSHYGNDGYILLMDFSKYYDNIQHDKALNMYNKYIEENEVKEKDLVLWLISVIFKQFEVDVSYLLDEEFENCLDKMFNSIEYETTVDESLRIGEKFMRKHLDLGNQTSQTTGIMYTIPITNYVKIVKGEKYYAIYMDDSYVIHPSKEHLQQLLKEIIQIAHENGIFLNEKKTRIVKLSDYWRFLQIQYSLTDTGRIIRKIKPKNLHKQYQKMKSLHYILSYKEFKDWANSWLQSHEMYMSKKQYGNYMQLMKQILEDIKNMEENKNENNS